VNNSAAARLSAKVLVLLGEMCAKVLDELSNILANDRAHVDHDPAAELGLDEPVEAALVLAELCTPVRDRTAQRKRERTLA